MEDDMYEQYREERLKRVTDWILSDKGDQQLVSWKTTVNSDYSLGNNGHQWLVIWKTQISGCSLGSNNNQRFRKKIINLDNITLTFSLSLWKSLLSSH